MNKTITYTNSKLRELLQEQRRLLAQFLLITREQTRLIANEDENALLQNLEQRQQIISQVSGRLDELSPLWRAYAASPAADSDLGDLLEEISETLWEIAEVDKKNRLVIHRNMSFLREQMRLAVETRRGAETYIKGTELFYAEYVDQRQ